MKTLACLLALLFVSTATAQQCSQCSAVDTCIREYMRAATKLRADHIKAMADQQKDVGQTGSINKDSFSIQSEVDKLKDCLGKIR